MPGGFFGAKREAGIDFLASRLATRGYSRSDELVHLLLANDRLVIVFFGGVVVPVGVWRHRIRLLLAPCKPPRSFLFLTA